MKEEWVETLNLMGKGDIYHEDYDEIICLCITCSWGSAHTRATSLDPMSRESKLHSGGVAQMDISNLMEYFKTDILGTLTTQLDVLQAKQKLALVEQNLTIFYPCCRNKHNQWECPLDMVQTCTIYTKYHDTEKCPSLPKLKELFEEVEG